MGPFEPLTRLGREGGTLPAVPVEACAVLPISWAASHMVVVLINWDACKPLLAAGRVALQMEEDSEAEADYKARKEKPRGRNPTSPKRKRRWEGGKSNL